MILMEFTPTGFSKQRLSTDDIAGTYQWYGYITAFPSLAIACTYKWGGYARPRFSDLELSPTVFESAWPPPKTATVKIIETETDETGGVTLFDGLAQRTEFDRESVRYMLQQPELDLTIAKTTNYTDTLVNVFSGLCSSLSLTLNSTNARSPSPGVIYTTMEEIRAIDLMDGMAAWFCHAFTIAGSTLYLYDMLDTGTPVALTEFDVQPCSYRDDTRVALLTSGDESVSGTYPSGETLDIGTAYHTVAGNITTALGNIKTVVDKDLVSIKTTINEDRPTILGAFTLTDDSTIQTTTSSGRIYSAVYSFDSLDLTLEAFGTVS